MQPAHQHGLPVTFAHTVGQAALQLAPVTLVTQHRLLLSQLTAALAPVEQSTLHGPDPQLTPLPQAMPEQYTEHELLAAQFTPPVQLGPLPLQETLQVPPPHVIGPMQLVFIDAWQRIVQALAALQSTSLQPPLQVTEQGPAPQRTFAHSLVQMITQSVAALQSMFPLQLPVEHWTWQAIPAGHLQPAAHLFVM